MTVNDKEHVTLPQFEGVMEEESTRIVLSGVHNSGEDELLQRLKDFTVLQRLFRLAFNGQLGEEFPVEKLVDLARQTHTPGPPCPTPRWLNRDKLTGESEEQVIAIRLQELASQNFERRVAVEVGDAARAKAQECALLLKAPGSYLIPSGRIENVCTLVQDSSSLLSDCKKNPGDKTESCALLAANLSLTSIVGIHKMREALGAVNPPKHIQAACAVAQ